MMFGGRTLFAIAMLLACGVAVANAYSVVEAFDDDFESVVKAHPYTIVMFYDLDCGICKQLMPMWEEAARTLKNQAQLVKVNGIQETKTAEAYDAYSFPTILEFKNGKNWRPFTTKRDTTEMIVKYIRGNLGKAVKAIASTNDLKRYTHQPSAVVLVYYGPTVPTAFAAVAAELRTEYTFAQISDSKLFNGATEGSIVLLKEKGKESEVYRGDVEDKDAITKFANTYSFAVFDQLGPANHDAYMARNLPIVWLFVDPRSAGFTSLTKDIRTIAKKYLDVLSFTWIDGPRYAQIKAPEQGLPKDGPFPMMTIDHWDVRYKWPEKKKMTKKALEAFFEDWAAGKLSRVVMSQPDPSPLVEGGVTTVTGNSVLDLVFNADTDVILMAHSPVCVRCIFTMPVFEDIAAEVLEKELPVLMAKIDIIANDLPGKEFYVHQYPTIFYKPKGSNQTVVFDTSDIATGGDPDEYKQAVGKALRKFIANHTGFAQLAPGTAPSLPSESATPSDDEQPVETANTAEAAASDIPASEAPSEDLGSMSKEALAEKVLELQRKLDAQQKQQDAAKEEL